MKLVICLLTLGCLIGCTQGGYNSSYIISDAEEIISTSASVAEEL